MARVLRLLGPQHGGNSGQTQGIIGAICAKAAIPGRVETWYDGRR